MQPWSYRQGQSGDEPSDRPAIIKEKDLEQFDKLAISDGGWAAPVEDVDYSERLVFSDEEDASVAADKRYQHLGKQHVVDCWLIAASRTHFSITHFTLSTNY